MKENKNYIMEDRVNFIFGIWCIWIFLTFFINPVITMISILFLPVVWLIWFIYSCLFKPKNLCQRDPWEC